MHRDVVSVYLGLGANLGDAQQSVHNASAELANLPLTEWVASSPLYQSSPVDAQGPDFVNAVVHLKTRLNAIDLLHACQAIENRAGRERPYPNAPRTLDIDILLFGEGNIQSKELLIPHPKMKDRAFVLLPLSEISPHLVSAADLLQVSGQPIGKINK
jgi:2-amino-4-hydroxy-6-hydroxymethyldihydropteridine diphosphokinase